MSVILDIDLDYFPLFDQPLGELERLLTWAGRPVDFVVEHHHEAFKRWKQMVAAHAIQPPHPWGTSSTMPVNKPGRADRHPASPVHGGQQFLAGSCATNVRVWCMDRKPAVDFKLKKPGGGSSWGGGGGEPR
ncbi:MAG: hypothetical protein NT167_27285 [Verrucomicrobia bacterium]|nr:hypothetical protein [Verrucomicrobiota bacterium]